MSEEKKKAIGGLWLNEGKNGKKYMSGSVNGQKIIIFKNDFKQEGDKSPDYKIFESTPKEGFTPATAQQVADILGRQTSMPLIDEDDSDQIPFF
jgi:hypothetical protein